MTIKQIFPRTVLILGFASVLLLLIPNPGQCDTCQQIYEETYGPSSGWDAKINSNSATGDCNLTATKTESGRITQVIIKANEKTGSMSYDIAGLWPSGWTDSAHYEGQINNLHIVSETHTAPDGSKNTITYDNDGNKTSETKTKPDGWYQIVTYDVNGRMTSLEEKTSDGIVLSVTYDPATCSEKRPTSCRITSATLRHPDGRVIVTIYDSDGSSTSTTYADGKAIAKSAVNAKTGEETIYTCINGICHSTKVALPGDSVPDPRGDVGGRTSAPRFPGGDFAGAKLKLKDEVLGQIEGKPRGDLTRAREKLGTGLVDQSKVGGPLQVKPELLPIKPKGEDLAGPKARVPAGLGDRFETKPGEAVGKASDLAAPGIDPAKPKSKARPSMDMPQQQTNIRPSQRFDPAKKKTGEAVGLNPQPLPPRETSRPVPAKKPTPGNPPAFKEKVKAQAPTLGQKEKLSATPRSQSVGKVLQSGAAQQKVQTQTVQPFKGKARPQDFRLPAGSSGAYPGLR